MRGKRAKQYRKLMHQYALTFNFHEPYQVLVDAQFVQDAARFKMDLVAGLERTLQGKVKTMITQCSIRHLYTAEPKDEVVISQAKTYERRRCNHHALEKPLDTLACFEAVVDPSNNNVNKHRYVVASQDSAVRSHLRRIPGVPLIYINRSVMIMEPMANATEELREQEEKGKFRAGLVGKRGVSIPTAKRKREEYEDENVNAPAIQPAEDVGMPITKDNREQQIVERRRKKGLAGPNPLSIKKAKRREPRINETALLNKQVRNVLDHSPLHAISEPAPNPREGPEDQAKKKRRRKHKGQHGNPEVGSVPLPGAAISS